MNGIRLPWHRRLLVRLLVTSFAVAACSVAATAWLAVETTTKALQQEQGQALAADMDLVARLSGYAARHSDWDAVSATVRALAEESNRRIALTTSDGRLLADSAPIGTPLPPRAAAAVDPLRTDTFSERGAQRSGIDPRAVGPFLLPAAERVQLGRVSKMDLAR